MRIYNIWTWPSTLIDDIRQWRIVRTALKEPEVIQGFKEFKYELRTDNIGRVYTVINVPEELWPYEKQNMVWPWMLEQLRELDDLLMRLRLNDLLYPEVSPIEGSPSYLVVLTPSTESFSIWKFLRWILNLSFVFVSSYMINSLVRKITGTSIVEFVISLF
jgi:hypothetical protein